MRVAIAILMCFNYLVTFSILGIMLSGDELSYARRYFGGQPEILTATVAWYAVGQLAFWIMFATKKPRLP
ncbi:MAG TPA: hypothetical protein VMZ26_13460 [Pyrinomonadaceae bacterium]|nr:hypothetical protein [Pyrinomonadaceae bacterium]